MTAETFLNTYLIIFVACESSHGEKQSVSEFTVVLITIHNDEKRIAGASFL